MVEPEHPGLSIRWQCALWGISKKTISIGRKQVRRLMHMAGLRAIYPGRVLSWELSKTMDKHFALQPWKKQFWRSLKYEDAYIKHYQSIRELKKGVARYCTFIMLSALMSH